MKTRYLLLLPLALLAACGGDSVEKLSQGTGPALSPDHVAYITMKYYKDANAPLFNSEKARDETTVTLIADAPDNVVGHYLLGQNVGDSLHFQIMAKPFYTESNGIVRMPEGMKASDMITFAVRIDSMVTREVYDLRQEELKALRGDRNKIRLQNKLYEVRVQYQERMNEPGVREQIAAEGKQIDAYIAQYGEKAFTTQNGVRMVIVEEEGMGNLLSPGDIIRVDYAGYLLDGTLFDTNMKEVARAHDMLDANNAYRSMKVQVGTNDVIQGWDEAFKTLSVGTKAVLYIPSPLAYGERGRGDVIPPNSPLRFEITIISSEKPF